MEEWQHAFYVAPGGGGGAVGAGGADKGGPPAPPLLLEICVRDSGIGLTAEGLQKLFSPFAQASGGCCCPLGSAREAPAWLSSSSPPQQQSHLAISSALFLVVLIW